MYCVQINGFTYRDSSFDKCQELGMQSRQEYKLFRIETTEIPTI